MLGIILVVTPAEENSARLAETRHVVNMTIDHLGDGV